jgi:integrase
MAKACGLAGLKDFHLHAIRKAITTWLGDQGEGSDVLDRILHHHTGYSTNQRFSFMAVPLRDAWQRWADHVTAITTEKAGGRVAEMVRA